MLSIVVLGAGSHSRAFHGPALKQVCCEQPGRYELSAVCDLDGPRAAAYAREFGFARSYASLDEMLTRERPGAFIAVTPMPATLEIATRILRAAVPVLVEKPPGLNTAQARQLADVARQTRTTHMVSFNRRFSPAVVKARQWVKQRGGGRPARFLSARILRHNRREENFVAHTGIHLTDTVLSFMGPPAGARAGRIDTGNPASHLYAASLTFASGAAGELLFASAVGRLEETYDLFGEDWHVRVEWNSGAVDAYDAGKLAFTWRPAKEDSPVYLNGTLDETREFLDCLWTGRTPRPNLEDALESFRLAEMIQAAKTDPRG